MRILFVAFAAVVVVCGGASAVLDVSFTGRSTHVVGGVMNDVCLVDVDGDGALDIVVPDASPPGLAYTRLLKGDGAGAFGAPVAIASGSSPWITPGDFDCDGDIDFVTNDSPPHVLVNDGKGVFHARPAVAVSPQFSFVSRASAGDLDGDGDLDVVALGDAGKFVELRNDGRARFTRVVLDEPSGTDAAAVEAVDLNGDGRADLVVAYRGSRVVQSFVSYRGQFVDMHSPLQLDLEPVGMLAADLDGDGDPDLAVAMSDVPGTPDWGEAPTAVKGGLAVFRNDGVYLGPWRTFQLNATPTSVRAADVNGDSRTDLVVLGSAASQVATLNEGVRVFLGDGSSFANSVIVAAPFLGGARRMDVGDVDGDGRVDVVTCDHGSTVGVMVRTPPSAGIVHATPSVLHDSGPAVLTITGAGIAQGAKVDVDSDLSPGTTIQAADGSLTVPVLLPLGIGASERTITVTNPGGATACARVSIRSIDLRVTKGSVVDAARPRRGRLTLRGEMSFNRLASVLGFSSDSDALLLRVGGAVSGFDLRVPARYRWTFGRRQRQTWRGRGPCGARVVLTIDNESDAFRLEVSRATLPPLPAGLLLLEFDDLGGAATNRGVTGVYGVPTRTGWRF